jgi:hypothetical protein
MEAVADVAFTDNTFLKLVYQVLPLAMDESTDMRKLTWGSI